MNAVEILRNTTLEQTRGVLRRGDCFCAGGVLCNEFDPTKWVECVAGDYAFDGFMSMVPWEVRKHFNLTDEQMRLIMDWNDQGKTFKEIAGLLEEMGSKERVCS